MSTINGENNPINSITTGDSFGTIKVNGIDIKWKYSDNYCYNKKLYTYSSQLLNTVYPIDSVVKIINMLKINNSNAYDNEMPRLSDHYQTGTMGERAVLQFNTIKTGSTDGCILVNGENIRVKGFDDLKKSVSDGKSAVSSAITNMGVSTASDASFDTMKDNILDIRPTLAYTWNNNIFKFWASLNGKNLIKSKLICKPIVSNMLYGSGIEYITINSPVSNVFNNNSVKSPNNKYISIKLGNTQIEPVRLNNINNNILVPSNVFGNATSENILINKTATSENGLKITGSMVNHQGINRTLQAGESFVIAKGYHNGLGKVIANNLKSQTNDASIMLEQIMPSSCFAYSRGKKITGNVSTTYLAEAYYWVPAKPNYGWQNINKNGTAFFFKQDHSHKLSTNIHCSKWASPYEVAIPLQDIFTLDTNYDILANTDDNNIFYIKGYNIINLAPGAAIYLYSPNWAIGKNRAVYIHSKWFTKDNPSADYYYISSTLSSILVATSVSKYFHIFNDRECTSNVSLGIQFNSKTGVLYIGNESDSQIWTMNDIWIESVD